MSNWKRFNYNLPGKLRKFLEMKVGDVNDFRMLPYQDSDLLVFVSKSTKIRVEFNIDMYGMLLTIWFPTPEQNNDEGDDTYTDHELFLEFDFLSA